MKKLYNAEAICNITLKEESPSNLAIWTNKRYRSGFWLNLKEYEVPDYAWCFRPQEIGEMECEVIGDDEDLIRQLPIGSQIDIRKEGYYCYVVWENIGPVESAIKAVTEGIIWLLKNNRYGKNV